MIIPITDLVLDNTVRDLCRRPYPGHPHGCPNYDVKGGCPPRAKLLSDVFDIEQPLFLVVNRFDMAAHLERMKAKHPTWSYRQSACCLYWQAGARKQLRTLVGQALREHPGYRIAYCPEAMGVNVTATMQAVGITLEWPPMTVAYQVAIIGKPQVKEQAFAVPNDDCMGNSSRAGKENIGKVTVYEDIPVSVTFFGEGKIRPQTFQIGATPCTCALITREWEGKHNNHRLLYWDVVCDDGSTWRLCYHSEECYWNALEVKDANKT